MRIVDSISNIFKNTYNLLALTILIILIILPFTPVPKYIIHLFMLLYMYIVLAQSWNIIGGMLGLIDFGHVVFFGVGAYAFAIAHAYYNIPWYLSALLGGGAAALIAIAISPILRLRGAYFAIGMFALAEAVRIGFTNWSWVGGGGGMYVPIPRFPDIYSSFYYIMFIIMMISNYVTYKFMNSKLGLAAVAFRENYMTAYTTGINIVKVRLYGFILSAIFPGIVGGIYAYYLSFVDPPTFLGEYLTALMIFMVVLGGRGTFLGPIIGAFITVVISQFMTYYFPGYDLVTYSIVIIVIIMFAPGGIYGLLRRFGVFGKSYSSR